MASRDYAKLARLHSEISAATLRSLPLDHLLPPYFPARFLGTTSTQDVWHPADHRPAPSPTATASAFPTATARFTSARPHALSAARAINPARRQHRSQQSALDRSQLTADELRRAIICSRKRRLRGGCVVASMGTKWRQNDRGTANLRELISRPKWGSQLYPWLALVLLGSADETPLSSELFQAWPGPRANLFVGAHGSATSSAVMRGGPSVYLVPRSVRPDAPLPFEAARAASRSSPR